MQQLKGKMWCISNLLGILHLFTSNHCCLSAPSVLDFFVFNDKKIPDLTPNPTLFNFIPLDLELRW